MVPIPSKMVYKRVRNHYYYYFLEMLMENTMYSSMSIFQKNSRFTVIQTLFEFALKLFPM